MVRKLRHWVSIFKGRNWYPVVVGPSNPRAFSAEELFELWPKGDDEGDSVTWPTTPAEMTARIKRAVSILLSSAHRFWDPGFSDWYISVTLTHPYDTEDVCKEAFLHAELWTNEHTDEEIWALAALREGWRVPDEAIEEALWRRVTEGPCKTEEFEPERISGKNTEFEF